MGTPRRIPHFVRDASRGVLTVVLPTATVWGVAHDDTPASAPERTLKVLVYSDDRSVRQQVRQALGKRPAPELAPVEFVECATPPVVISTVDSTAFDLLILDGEAVPAGGMGICRQLKDEVYNCPPVLLLVGRPQDAWLATWSRADAVVAHPLDAVAVANATAGLLRRRSTVARA